MSRNDSRDTGLLGDFFEAGRAYTTQTGYLAPEHEWNFACAAVGSSPDGELIAFGFFQAGRPQWTPTGFGRQDFLGHAWNPARPPEWLTADAATAHAPGSPLARTQALKTITKVLKQPVEGVAAADLIYGRALAHIESPTGDAPRPWAMQVDVLALKIAAQLPLTDDTEPKSPLAEAEDAKRRRDLDGEIAAVMRGSAALTSAPWSPARPGDLVHVHYKAVGQMPAFGETYLVAAGSNDGFLNMQLLAHTLPEDTEFLDGMVGCFAVDDDPEPLSELWMEAGPHRLTIIRDGRPVHIGGAR